MKRTFERLTFMVIGAAIAGIAYFIGNADPDAQAQDMGELLRCDTLLVGKRIIVGGPDPSGNFITLEVYKDNAVINVTQGGLPTEAKGRVTLQAHKNQAMLTLNKGGLPPNTKSLILLGVNDDSSRIRIKDHSGSDFIVDSQKIKNIMKNSGVESQ